MFDLDRAGKFKPPPAERREETHLAASLASNNWAKASRLGRTEGVEIDPATGRLVAASDSVPSRQRVSVKGVRRVNAVAIAFVGEAAHRAAQEAVGSRRDPVNSSAPFAASRDGDASVVAIYETQMQHLIGPNRGHVGDADIGLARKHGDDKREGDKRPRGDENAARHAIRADMRSIAHRGRSIAHAAAVAISAGSFSGARARAAAGALAPEASASARPNVIATACALAIQRKVGSGLP